MLDNQGFIAEGGTESLFLVREGGLLTPTLGTILPSITRKSLLEVAEAMGIRTFTGRLTQGHLDEVDEIFFSATPAKLRPVSQVESRILREAPGPVTRRLSDKMKEILSGRDRQFKDWLFPVS
jgi:branched-chain amino acid aminotransferase